jgi:hypothetical protein
VLQHSLVAGLFIPQFENPDYATIVIADPEWDEFRERLSEFSRDQIGRAISQVAHAKELAMLDLPNTANTLVRAEGNEETVARAISRDLSWQGAPNRHLTRDGLVVEREYRWSESARLAENLAISGVRFRGSLPFPDVETLEAMMSPAEYGEQKHSDSLGRNWAVLPSDTGVSLQSPFGSTFELSALEP